MLCENDKNEALSSLSGSPKIVHLRKFKMIYLPIDILGNIMISIDGWFKKYILIENVLTFSIVGFYLLLTQLQ